jgi:UPF0271 protein
MKKRIDLNCDLGEEMPYDNTIFPLISSANIACGFHAGNANTIRNSIEKCIIHQVKIGAHPSYNDRENFGRVEQQLAVDALKDLIVEQIEILLSACEKQKANLHHIKLHGALYNQAAINKEVAIPILEAIHSIIPNTVIYGLSESVFNQLALDMGFSVMHEVFADRKYTSLKNLVPRNTAGAVINNHNEVLQQVEAFIQEEEFNSIDGIKIRLKADTICLHGDGEHALFFAQSINRFLIQKGITISAQV